jgi:hypothetical protein
VAVWFGGGGLVPQLMPTTFLWGLCLIVAMLIMAWQAATSETAEPGFSPPGGAPADD